MDNDSFARFSNSWSYGSDPRSEESICNKNRDYTSEFTTNQIFENREDMLNWAKRVGLENGIVVVIKNSAKKSSGKMPKCILACERGGKYRPETSQIRNTETKKCECPFELRGIPVPPDGVMWGLRVLCGIHNHPTAEFMDGHEYPSRLKPMEKQFVLDMANSTAPREILSILKQKDSSNSTGVRSIYNVIRANKSAKRGGLTQVQYVLEQLIKKGYLHDYLTDPDTNEITDILWLHPKNLALAVNFSSVLIIDATYKTNEYRLPLLEVVGITSTLRTYSLMFAYLSHEKVKNLEWALSILKRLMLEKGATLPSVFVSDRDLALLNGIGKCFPSSHHILCIWHINHCVLKKCRPMLGLEWNKFSSSWSYIDQLPAVMHQYISKIVDVAPDGHCGFRAIAALIGYGEEGWMQVRAELIDEIQQNKAQYDVIFPDNSTSNNLLFLLNYFETPAPERHWMESMTLGTVIASRYNIVLYIFGGTNWSCYTHLPLRSPPIRDNERMEIVIGHVGNHFVQLFLHPYHPVPPVPTWWWNHSSYEVKGWASSYQVRADLWREITSMGPPGAQFGGNID